MHKHASVCRYSCAVTDMFIYIREMPKAPETKEMIDTLDLIQLKTLCIKGHRKDSEKVTDFLLNGRGRKEENI